MNWKMLCLEDEQGYNRYPDFLPQDIAKVYQDYCGTDNTLTVAVRGADEAIDLLIRTFANQHKTISSFVLRLTQCRTSFAPMHSLSRH